MFTACELLFDIETAAKVRRELRSKLGGECPCDRDEKCPLLPAHFILKPRPPVGTRESLAEL